MRGLSLRKTDRSESAPLPCEALRKAGQQQVGPKYTLERRVKRECGTEHCGGTKARDGGRGVLEVAGLHQDTPEHALWFTLGH